MNPIKAQVKHSFQANNPQELSILNGQTIYIAPREIQNTQHLLNTGWVLATIDNQTSGIIPLNYIQGPQQHRQNADAQPYAANTPAEPKIFAEPNAMHIPPKDGVFEPKIYNGIAGELNGDDIAELL